MPEIDLGRLKDTQNGTAEARYTVLSSTRQPFLRRAWDASKLTIPSLLPEDGHSVTSQLYQPFQSVGSRGVNNLSSRLMLTMLPPSFPFFRLSIDDFVLEQMKREAGPEVVTEIHATLAQIEKAVMNDIESRSDRNALSEGLRHLIVTGNILLYDDPETGLRPFHLNSYVVQRDAQGTPLEIIVKESLAHATLPDEVRKIVETSEQNFDKTAERTVDVYTWLRREPKRWVVHQEVQLTVIPSSQGTYPLDAFPWFPLRMIQIAGEDYGRSYVEEYIGDLKSLEGLSKALVEGTAAAAKVLILVAPNGTTRQKTIAEAPNGAVREGNAEDVSVLQMEKFNDFRVAFDMMSRLETRLGQAFLLNSAVTRDAERVTAEEIRLMAQELEAALGGIYSLMTNEFQLPYVQTKLRAMSRKPGWPKLPKDLVRPRITTGLEALGRSHERNRLIQFMTTIQATMGPEALSRYLVPTEAIKRLALSDGIDTDGLIKTEAQVAQELQAAQTQEMMRAAAPNAVNAMGDMVMSAQQPSRPQG